MKLIFDQPEIMNRAATEMSNQGTPNDWRNSIRQFQILDAFSYNFKDQAQVSKSVLTNYKKLLTTTQDREDKLEYFERSVLEIAKLYQLDQNDQEIKFQLYENMEQLFQLLGPLSIQGFERLFTEEFKFNFQLHFSSDYLLDMQNQIRKNTGHQNFLDKPQNLYDKLIQMVQELMKSQNNIKDNIKIQDEIASQQPMPKLLYLSSNKMNKKINDTEYFKFTEKINQKFEKGKQQFLNFLIDNIEIKINGIIIHKLNQQDLELYEQDIINFFLLNDFNDSSDKEVMNFIKNKLKKL